MRIGFDISPLRRPRTGVGNYCYFQLKHLLRIGGDCEFIGFASGLQGLDLDELAGGLAYRTVPVPTRVLYRFWSMVGAPKVDALLGGSDVYHATNYFLPPTRSARRVVTIYDLSFLTMPEHASPKITRVFSKGVQRFAREADAVLTCSEATKSDIIRHLGVPEERIRVAYGAVDDAFAPMAPEAAAERVAARFGIQQPFILFVSTIEPRKNVPALVRAFGQLARDIPHTLVLAGPTGWRAEAVSRAIHELGLGDRVIRAGFIPERDDLAALYSAAGLFAFPSLYEGFGLPVLEAMTCGCPVVTADNSTLPEGAGDAARLIDAGDVPGIAAAMRRVLENDGLREAMVRKGIAQAQRFSWDACARKTLDVYKTVLSA